MSKRVFKTELDAVNNSLQSQVNNSISKNIVDAKGDIVTASAADTPIRLAVGTNEQRLVVDSATTSGLKYVADTTNYAVGAKGDLLVGTAADTVSALTVGANGETLVADSSATTGLRWQGNYAAGKNYCLNGAMQIAQRGTSITIGASGYSLDRYSYSVASAVPTGTISQQTFTPGAAPVAGYEGSNFMRIDITANNGCTTFNLTNVIEDVRTLAGQTATFSFWAKADGASTLNQVVFSQGFGSGGSATVNTSVSVSPSLALTTGWTRYTATFSVPSISGKTIGTGSSVGLIIQLPKSGSNIRNGTYDFWGWQLEAGNVATAFQTATGTLAGELAACQRYYWRISSSDTGQTTNYLGFANGYATSTTNGRFTIYPPVTLRTGPTSLDYSQLVMADGAGGGFNPTAITIDTSARTVLTLSFTTTGLTQFRPYALIVNGTTTGYLAFSAEL